MWTHVRSNIVQQHNARDDNVLKARFTELLSMETQGDPLVIIISNNAVLDI